MTTTILITKSANARTLHIGEQSFTLDTQKRTSPALAVRTNNETFWGALYSGTAPSQTLHIQTDQEYWLGQNCAPGTYSETGVSACTDCGIGHYCTGSNARKSCTYGAISCTGTTHATDAPMPDGAPINKFMTLDEVNQFMPVTDFSDWQLISVCYTFLHSDISDTTTLNDVSNACATGTIGPGTYLFITRYSSITNETRQDSLDGTTDLISSAVIAVFDHPVSYASMHGNDIFQHFIDTQHTEYKQYTISSSPIGHWNQNINATNVTNLTEVPRSTRLFIYELK